MIFWDNDEELPRTGASQSKCTALECLDNAGRENMATVLVVDKEVAVDPNGVVLFCGSGCQPL